MGHGIWPLVALNIIGGFVNEISAQEEILLMSMIGIKKVPEGARIAMNEGGEICLENWPGIIRIDTARMAPNVALLYAEELEARDLVLWTRNMDRLFMVDSIKVRFSGCIGEGGDIPINIPGLSPEFIWIDEIRIED